MKKKKKKNRLKFFKRVKNILTGKKEGKYVWREYVDSQTGEKYYSNGVITTWNAPKIFDKQKQLPSSSSSNSVGETKSFWTEYEDPTTGKYYYSDGVTTTWKKPKLFMTNY